MKKMLNNFRADNSEMKISLSELAKHKEIYFVGDNGCGKSSLLRTLRDNCNNAMFLTQNANIHYSALINKVGKLTPEIVNKSSYFFKCNVSECGTDLFLDINNVGKFYYLDMSKGYQYMVLIFLCIADAVCYDKVNTVFIDDFASNLSPNNVYKLIELLRKVFPNTQFVFATNNPIAIMGASRDAVIYRLHINVANKIIAEDPFYASEMSHLMANGVITCPLFNMESARMRAYDESQDEDLDTSTSYLHGRIRKLLADEVKEMRKERGTPFISPEKIDDIIKNAIKKHKAE